MRIAIAVLVFAGLASECLAAVDLIVWQSMDSSPRLVLPRQENETSEQAVKRYVRNLHAHPELNSMLPSEGLEFQSGQTQVLGEKPRQGAVRTALIANEISDMTAEGARIQRNIRTFGRAGADPYVVALSADLGLTEADAEDFRNKVATRFDLVVSLGGPDIDPSLYGQELTFSVKTNPTRDVPELKLVQAVKRAARSVFFGICRGHQMGAIADGHTLHQDLTATGQGDTSDHVNREGTTTTEMQTWHHIAVVDSLLARFLGTVGQVEVNSLHHQAVNPSTSAASFVIATHPTSGVEALQMKNGMGLSTQFHGEFPEEVSGNATFSSMGFKIIKGIVSLARLRRIEFHRDYSRAAMCSSAFGK